MKSMPFISAFFTVVLFTTQAISSPDPNFQIYIAFGQSNMEGQATVIDENKVPNDRFKVLASMTCSNMNRTLGEWAVAVPPLFHCYTGLSPADYFGKTMADSLPGITIGVIPVAVAGTAIRLFDEDLYKGYLDSAASWLQAKANDYGGDPYARIIDLAKEAQQVGVIKGILLHQGETDAYSDSWRTEVKKIYTKMLSDLGLSADTVPLIAGEVLATGTCKGANTQIDALPNMISTAHVVSSTGCTGGSDNLHFDNAGYQELGKRYAQVMLSLLKTRTPVTTDSSALAPFKDTLAIPGTIEAEDYDKGGAGLAFYDTDPANETTLYRTDNAGIDSASGAYVYGWVAAGEWLRYTVNVKESGAFTYTAQVASASTDAAFTLTLDGTQIANVAVPNTGAWKTFQEISGTTPTLTAGTHVLKLIVDTAYFNVDWIKFEKPGTERIAEGVFAGNPEQAYIVYDLFGRKVTAFRAAPTSMEAGWNIARKDLPAGIYLLKSGKNGEARQMMNARQ